MQASAGVVIALAMVGCGRGAAEPSSKVPSPTTMTALPPSTAPSTAATTAIAVRLERLVDDEATAGFADVVVATLTDPRGWTRAGFVFTFSDNAPYTIVLAEGSDVDARCAPYDTAGRFSCQLGAVVALNADRWRTATPEWTADLDSYRQMLVNHEVGHLLGQHHPTGGCTTPGDPSRSWCSSPRTSTAASPTRGPSIGRSSAPPLTSSLSPLPTKTSLCPCADPMDRRRAVGVRHSG